MRSVNKENNGTISKMTQTAQPFDEPFPPVLQHFKPLTQIVEEEQQDEALLATLADRTAEDFPVRVSSSTDQSAFEQFVKGLYLYILNC